MSCKRINAPIPKDLLHEKKSIINWHIILREHEWRAFEKELRHQSLNLQESNVLEIGAGNGTQARMIAKGVAKLIVTDIDKKKVAHLQEVFHSSENVKVKVVKAEELESFSKESFDLVVASNVMEHIQNPMHALQQIHTLLKPQGFLVIALPNRTWKIFNTLIGYIVAFRDRSWRKFLSLPIVHGKYKSNIEEFLEFGCRSWEKKFSRSDFIVAAVIRLPFYYGHGTTFLPLLKIGNYLHLSSSYGFLLRKT